MVTTDIYHMNKTLDILGIKRQGKKNYSIFNTYFIPGTLYTL